MLPFRRTLALVFCAAIVRAAPAATPAEFALLGDGSSIVWSIRPLARGDVIEVHAFKADPGTIVQLAVCADRCDDAHVVKSVSVYSAQINTVTVKYTLQESGHLAFWTVRPPRLELNPGASRAISDDSRNVAGVLHSGFSGLYSDAEVLHINHSELDPDQAKLRFDGGRYIIVKRIGVEPPTNPPVERP